MANGERYQVRPGDGCPFCVLDTERSIVLVVAECGTRPDAEKIAATLNDHRGAVEALCEIKRVAAIEAPPVSEAVPAKVWKIAHDALNVLGGR